MSGVRVPSRSNPEVFYEVTIGLDGALQCDCPASFNSLKCWHLAAAMDVIEWEDQQALATTEEAKRFWSYVAHPLTASGCWPWTGAHDKYGHFGRGSMKDDTRRIANAHAVAFELANGGPAVNQVLHHCDVPLCCRPSHLYDGTQSENVSDSYRRNRRARRVNMTTESRALVPIVVKPSDVLLPTEHELSVVERAAAMAFAGAVSLPQELNTPAKVAAVMLYGLELGVKPMTALRHLYIVKGKVSPSAELMAGICMAREKDIAFHIEQLTAEVCTIRMVRPSRNVDAKYTVTWAQIKTAGLASGTNVNYPEDRLRYHCMKRLIRAYAPDLINNMDEGVAVAGLREGEDWRPTVVDNDDLYSEGDVPENVDRETGEVLDEGAQQGGDASALDAAGSPSRDEPAAPSPAVDWSAFNATLKAAGVTTEDVVRVVPISSGTPTAGDFKRWIEANPGKTAPDLFSAILKARIDACEHDAGQYDEALTIMRCSKCGLELDGPPAEEAEQPALA